MLTLFIETCTERSIVAIVENEHCCYMAGLPFGLHNSQYLVPKIEEGFHDLGIQAKELNLIVAGVGPGSYTGIRVGASVAKTLSYTLKIPLVGITTLKGFIPDCDCKFAAILDAKMSGTYLLKGERRQEKVSYLSDPQICVIENLPNVIGDVEVLVTPSLGQFTKKIENTHPNAKWTWQETAADPIHMTQLGLEKFEKGDFSVDGTLDLLYMRSVD